MAIRSVFSGFGPAPGLNICSIGIVIWFISFIGELGLFAFLFGSVLGSRMTDRLSNCFDANMFGVALRSGAARSRTVKATERAEVGSKTCDAVLSSEVP